MLLGDTSLVRYRSVTVGCDNCKDCKKNPLDTDEDTRGEYERWLDDRHIKEEYYDELYDTWLEMQELDETV